MRRGRRLSAACTLPAPLMRVAAPPAARPLTIRLRRFMPLASSYGGLPVVGPLLRDIAFSLCEFLVVEDLGRRPASAWRGERAVTGRSWEVVTDCTRDVK